MLHVTLRRNATGTIRNLPPHPITRAAVFKHELAAVRESGNGTSRRSQSLIDRSAIKGYPDQSAELGRQQSATRSASSKRVAVLPVATGGGRQHHRGMAKE